MFASTVKNGKTRIYATNGSTGAPNPYSALFRIDDASQLVAGRRERRALEEADVTNVNGEPLYATFDFCTGQCWYDQDVATPPGEPDTVFVIGSYTYGEAGLRSNARAVYARRRRASRIRRTTTGRSPT